MSSINIIDTELRIKPSRHWQGEGLQQEEGAVTTKFLFFFSLNFYSTRRISKPFLVTTHSDLKSLFQLFLRQEQTIKIQLLVLLFERHY